MSQENGRKALHAYLTADAHEMWHCFAADQGVSVSAILEALAPALTPAGQTSPTTVTKRIDEIISTARSIDAERRRRRR